MRPDVCYYDGACGMCRRTARTLAALDWLGRLAFEDLTRSRDLPVSMDAAMSGMPMRTRDGTVLVGFPAVRRALRQTPLGFVPALMLHLPGVASAGSWAYGHIARRRRRACDAAAPAVGRQGATAFGRASP
ncbi:MAG: DUF393 domain-containing protein [Phycisphaerae bacterium]|nr:DUF393 domain-containing protein [Phycisphaerae bacterium]